MVKGDEYLLYRIDVASEAVFQIAVSLSFGEASRGYLQKTMPSQSAVFTQPQFLQPRTARSRSGYAHAPIRWAS